MVQLVLHDCLNIIYGKLTIGDYSLYGGMIGQMTGSIYALIDLVAQIRDNDLRLESYEKFLQWESNLSNCGSLKPISPIRIDFVDVSLKYPGTEEFVLNKLNFVSLNMKRWC